MSRRHVSAAPTVSLFPFLAVLLCTMGALLVLLVLFSRAAEDGKIAHAAVADRSRAEVAARIDRWRASVSATASRLQRERARKMPTPQRHARMMPRRIHGQRRRGFSRGGSGGRGRGMARLPKVRCRAGRRRPTAGR